MSNHDQLERRLQTAGSTFDEVTIAPDAWQENQRRLAEDRSRRNRWLLGAVAAGLVAVLVGGAALLATQAVDSGPPASSGSDDPWAPENVLGPPVVLERIVTDGRRVDLQGVLSDTTGDGPNLCTQAVAEGYGFGSCIAREPSADKPSVAVDWLMGTEGDGAQRGVVAGVDERVASVEVWMSDGARVVPALHPTGWEQTRMFSLTVAADGPRPQRLVAMAGDGNVLQAIDLASRFGSTWLVSTRASCGGTVTGRWPAAGTTAAAGVAVSWSTTDALVTAPGGAPACLDPLRATALAGWTRIGDALVVAVAPEVESVRIMVGEDLVGLVEPSRSQGSPFQVAVAKVGKQALLDAEVVALDKLNIELDREFVNQPQSP